MQPRSHPSPPRITRCLFVRCWSYRHTAPHSTAKARPAQMQRIEITTETHPPTAVSAPEHNSTIGPNLPFHLFSTRSCHSLAGRRLSSDGSGRVQRRAPSPAQRIGRSSTPKVGSSTGKPRQPQTRRACRRSCCRSSAGLLLPCSGSPSLI